MNKKRKLYFPAIAVLFGLCVLACDSGSIIDQDSDSDSDSDSEQITEINGDQDSDENISDDDVGTDPTNSHRNISDVYYSRTTDHSSGCEGGICFSDYTTYSGVVFLDSNGKFVRCYKDSSQDYGYYYLDGWSGSDYQSSSDTVCGYGSYDFDDVTNKVTYTIEKSTPSEANTSDIEQEMTWESADSPDSDGGDHLTDSHNFHLTALYVQDDDPYDYFDYFGGHINAMEIHLNQETGVLESGKWAPDYNNLSSHYYTSSSTDWASDDENQDGMRVTFGGGLILRSDKNFAFCMQEQPSALADEEVNTAPQYGFAGTWDIESNDAINLSITRFTANLSSDVADFSSLISSSYSIGYTDGGVYINFNTSVPFTNREGDKDSVSFQQFDVNGNNSTDNYHYSTLKSCFDELEVVPDEGN